MSCEIRRTFAFGFFFERSFDWGREGFPQLRDFSVEQGLKVCGPPDLLAL